MRATQGSRRPVPKASAVEVEMRWRWGGNRGRVVNRRQSLLPDEAWGRYCLPLQSPTQDRAGALSSAALRVSSRRVKEKGQGVCGFLTSWGAYVRCSSAGVPFRDVRWHLNDPVRLK